MNDHTPASQALSTNQLSYEYVNAVFPQHGYQNPETVIARLYQWIGLHVGVKRFEDRAGCWIDFDAAHKLFDPVAVDAAPPLDKEMQHEHMPPPRSQLAKRCDAVRLAGRCGWASQPARLENAMQTFRIVYSFDPGRPTVSPRVEEFVGRALERANPYLPPYLRCYLSSPLDGQSVRRPPQLKPRSHCGVVAIYPTLASYRS